jgi:hypothetical protein
VTLPGWSTVDAISPDGRWLYLIQYKSSDISKYAVRAYDLAAHRLLREPVVDPREPEEKMTGFPITRVMSAGERWAYTLYFRPSGAPFIHALDTLDRRAFCVDLPSLSGTDIGNGHLHLTAGGGTLQIDDGVGSASMDTRTFAVTKGSAPPPTERILPVSSKPAITHESDSLPWAFIVLGILALSVLAVVGAGRGWPRRAHDDRRAPGSWEHFPPEHDDTSREPDRQPAPWTSSR